MCAVVSPEGICRAKKSPTQSERRAECKMRNYINLISIFIGMFVTIFSTQVWSLDYSIHENDSPNLNAIYATGELSDGDTIKLETYLRTLPVKQHIAVYLDSPGGSLFEGMALGLFFRKMQIKTVIEGGKMCASACALAFLGGTDNKGQIWRSSSDNSLLGFHAFYSSEEQMDSNTVQQIVGSMLIYAQQVEAPLETLIAGFLTPSEEMYYLSEGEICALGIKLWSNKYDKFIC